jgi:vacuolar-type H+-ATPase subunit E/Vma4
MSEDMAQSETNEAGKKELIESIKNDARAEAEKTLEEAERSARNKILDAEEQVKRSRKDAEEKAEEQADVIRKNNEAAIDVEKRRITLRLREKVFQEVYNLVRNAVGESLNDPNHKDVLKGWIIEAAVGLEAEKAFVNASRDERALIDEGLLRQCEEKVKQLIGKTVSLEITGEKPLTEPGVILTTEDNRMAYNNQLSTRIDRHKAEIRKMIYQELFADQREHNE